MVSLSLTLLQLVRLGADNVKRPRKKDSVSLNFLQCFCACVRFHWGGLARPLLLDRVLADSTDDLQLEMNAEIVRLSP
jgi:hypothetical protein